MRGLGYKSVSTVATHVDNLIAAGWLRKKDNSARSLELVSRGASNDSVTIGRDGYAVLQQITDRIEAEYADEGGVYDKETLEWVLGQLRGDTKVA